MKIVLVLWVMWWLGMGIATAQPVQICDDSAEWPPYSFFPRVPGKIERPLLTKNPFWKPPAFRPGRKERLPRRGNNPDSVKLCRRLTL